MQRSLLITRKQLVIRCEVLSELLYLEQMWPIPRYSALAITHTVSQFPWGSKMEQVRQITMQKSTDKGDKVCWLH